MAWKNILTPADYPLELKAVLVSDGSTTGVGYFRPRESYVNGYRQDGWVLVWPCDPNQTFVVKKWDELPVP